MTSASTPGDCCYHRKSFARVETTHIWSDSRQCQPVFKRAPRRANVDCGPIHQLP